MSYDSDVINATSGRGEANWDQIIKLCNRIRDSVGPTSMSQAMGSVLKRVKHSDPNVQLHALTLLEACVSNCGKSFQSELTKPAFLSEFKSIITGTYADPRVTQRCKDLVVSWANEFQSDSSMSGMVRFLEQLRKDGISFQGLQQPTTSAVRNHPTPSSNEDEDLVKAIQLSLQDSNPTPSTTPSLYPTMPLRSSPTPVRKKEMKKVRAIYDFEAAEDNELSFRAGEIITVLDDSDENWWRGETQLGNGLFPASFISTNLSVDPEPSPQEAKESKKSKSGHKSKGTKNKGKGSDKVVINTEKIDLLLDMIKGADVTSEENLAENETLLELEEECKKMRPIVEETIAGLQRQEDEMQSINQKFEESLALYRKLLAQAPRLTATMPVQVQTTPTPIAPPTATQQYSTQNPITQHFSAPNLPPQLSTSNPPPYFPPISTGPTLQSTTYSSKVPSSESLHLPSLVQLPPTQVQLPPAQVPLAQPPLQQPPVMQMKVYPGTHVGMEAEPSMNSYSQPLPPPPTGSLFAQPQPQVIAESVIAPPPNYHPTTSLYNPAQQPPLL